MSYSNAIQQAIYTALSGDDALMAVVTGVYDSVPQASGSGSNTAFPFVTIGEDVISAWDTDSEMGCDGSITIHVWSRQKGRKQTKDIQGLIFEALARAELTVQGYVFVTCEWEQDDSVLDPDGQTRHGVSTYRFIMQRNPVILAESTGLLVMTSEYRLLEVTA